MTPAALLSRRATPPRLVIFDCDGVLVDSEGIANRVTARWISELGWAMTPAESDRHFLGMSLDDMMPVIAARIGRPVPPDWRAGMMADFIATLGREVVAIDGAIAALDGMDALGMPWRVATNSSHAEIAVKFHRLGLSARVAGRAHSFEDVPRGKPAPDLFLATAAAEGVTPGDCVVIEDSATGARAARAAGMDCLGFAPHGHDDALRAEGAAPFRSMYHLPDLIRDALRIHA